jgi:YgiT-type zinc finger domain-containing protein
MTCFFCKGNLEHGTTKHHADLGAYDVIIRDVPCRKCTQCGEIVFNIKVGERLEQIIDAIKDSVSEVKVVQYSEIAAA